MTWTRLDDRWTDRPQLAELTYEARWHYLAMIQFCSRTDRVDGILTVRDAQRCSDVDDPDAAHAQLLAAGLLVKSGACFHVTEIHDHVPPPSVRQNAENSKIRMRRKRAHASGDHTLCLPDHCNYAESVTPEVTGDVTRNPGTGRDGTGQAPTEADSRSAVTRNGVQPIVRSAPRIVSADVSTEISADPPPNDPWAPTPHPGNCICGICAADEMRAVGRAS